MTSPDSLEEQVPDDVLWWRFADQTRTGHALVALAGFAIWIGVYLHGLDAAGGFELVVVERPTAVVARREAMQTASLACWLWFSVAFAFGKGGPFLNTVIYPTVALVLGPFVPAAALGSTPGSISGGQFDGLASSGFTGHVLWIFLPGALLSLLLVGGFLLAIYFVTGTGEAWADRHMPEAYHEIEIEDPAASEE